MLFLVFVEECERHHGVTPIDRGQHGVRFRFSYISPNDNEQYGTLSLTLYPTTSRLLVQGTSYLPWVDEHQPIIHREAEVKYLGDVTKWHALTLCRGIGVRNRVINVMVYLVIPALMPIGMVLMSASSPIRYLCHQWSTLRWQLEVTMT